MDRNTQRALALGLGIAGTLGARALSRRRSADLSGGVAVITGGSRGLGLVLARVLAAEGMRLVLCSRYAAELERARRDLEARGATVHVETCDVTDQAQVRALAEAARTRFGRVDALINNAGIIQAGPMEVMTVADYEEAMRIHFWAPLFTTLEFLPDLREARGRIVNIASVGGKIAAPHLLPYCASKFALVGLSEGLRAELAQYGVSVTTVCPGLMRTGSHLNAYFKGQHRQEYAWFSISDSLPGSSISAESTARRIVCGMKRREAELVLSLPAQVAVLFHGLFPGETADFLGAVNRLLPKAGGIGTERRRGHQSQSPLAPEWVTTLSDQAAARNNEVPAA